MERLKNVGITVGTIGVATCIGMLMQIGRLTEANIIMSYIVGVVVIARYTTQWEYSLVGAFGGVALFNYFFAAPYYSFKVNEIRDVITFSSMLLVAFVIITLTSRVKQEAIVSQHQEALTKKLYEMGRALLDTDNLDQTKATSIVMLGELFERSTWIMEVDRQGHVHSPLVYEYGEAHTQENGLHYQVQRGIEVVLASRQPLFDPIENMSVIPLLRKDNILGIVGISDWCIETVPDEDRQNLEAMVAQMSLALEREYARIHQQEMALGVQKEKLKNSMLQGISHDLRTPLTGILGSAHTLQENWGRMSDEQIDQLLDGIHDEASWLYHSVENILNITRFDDGRQILNKEMELVEDLLGGVRSRVEGITKEHPLKITLSTPDLLVPMDVNLMVKVLYNLVDNAVKYTPIGQPITMSAYEESGKAVIEVMDRGPGIPVDDLPHIFRRFYRGQNKLEGVSQSRNGIGIGLTICQTIVEAHGGVICVFNNPEGGATFKLILPMEDR